MHSKGTYGRVSRGIPKLIAKGSKMPKFELKDQDGNAFKSSDLAGTKSVIYFYPKDFTPGCTVEADEFTSKHATFKKRKIRVIGLSPDDSESHKKFCTKKEIPYMLLADTDHVVAEKFGVWGMKKFMGKSYMGVNRSTFLTNEDGTILEVFEKVKPLGHADQVLEFFEQHSS